MPIGLSLAQPRLHRQSAYIDGAWIDGSSYIGVCNPADGSEVGRVPDLGAARTSDAVAAAHRAFPAWASLAGRERATALRRWADLMLRHQDDLARLMTAEQGKPLSEARIEVAYAASFLSWFAEEARRIEGSMLTPHQVDRRLLVSKQPIGVVAAITPWNFPSAMITRKAGPALAVGCTMVLKPSELTPFSALALAELAEEAGIPAGVFNVVTGTAAPIGEVMTRDPRVRKFTFTGSTAVGKTLAARCMSTVKRVSLELGGNAPFIVFDDADLEGAVAGAVASKFGNSGQTCVCANRFYVEAGIYDRFAVRLAERVRELLPGDGSDERTTLGPLIDSRAVAKVTAHVEDAVNRGGRLMCGGSACAPPGTFFEPTVIADAPPDALLCREETFGPLAGLVRFQGEDEAIQLANDTQAGLALTSSPKILPDAGVFPRHCNTA